VLVRFSDGTGVPNIPDAAPGNVHGMAIRFFLPDESSTDIVALSVNAFPAATPEDFLAFLKAAGASGPDAPKPTHMDKFMQSHPAAVKFVKSITYPASFATQTFYGLDAFRFTNAEGVSRYGRYRITPMAGEHMLTDAEAAKAGPDYLMDELPARLKKHPVKYRISVQLAEKGDNVNDITAIWPDDRKEVALGVLTLKAAVPDSKEEEKTLMFSPMNVTDGIDGSDDPILAARPIAYAISFGRRNGQ
jgi:catalase